jgi:hypothetical protein
MKRLVAGIGIIICAIVVFVVGGATVQAQITNDAASSLSVNTSHNSTQQEIYSYGTPTTH